MKLLRVHVIRAATCGGLLDGLDVRLHDLASSPPTFSPLCFVGPNGAGKSQFLQVLAEMFQSAFHVCVPAEEREEANVKLEFELEYLIKPSGKAEFTHVLITRRAEGKRRPALTISTLQGGNWVRCDLTDITTAELLPAKVIGYTSGDNETLSLPFLVSRSGYAEEVGTRALSDAARHKPIPDTRLMLIDYETHLEVLVANLLLGHIREREALLEGARLSDIDSFRCIIQLAHSAAPKAPRLQGQRARKGVQLTPELEGYIDQLRRCATCYTYDERTETYIFDFWINDATRLGMRTFWNTALDLYSAFHKLAMLNDLAIPKATRERFRRATRARRFPTRLPEPQDEQKIFRFERVNFLPKNGGSVVDYVSLSDGEHQLAQVLGVFCMASYANVLFLLDEPESHFNPRWRVSFVSRVLDLPTQNGSRSEASEPAHQDCILTTHAPFVPSDMSRTNVFIFKKPETRVEISHPDVETYGTTFDTILSECFDVQPPISKVSLGDIDELLASQDIAAVQEGIARLGDSVEKALVVDHLRQLEKGS